MYKIVYEKRAFKDLDKIPNADVKKIIDVFKEKVIWQNKLAQNQARRLQSNLYS